MFNKIKSYSSNKTVVLLLLLITLASILKFQSNQYHDWSNKGRLDRTVIRSDGSGYYAYLPQVFIYKDLHYVFIDSVTRQYPNSKIGEFGNFPPGLKGRLNKFFPGVAICQAPFFLVTHAFHSKKYQFDGYSYPYQKSIATAAILYLLLGIVIAYFLLLELSISPLAAGLSLAGVALGTPLLFYTINEPLASHVYSFAAISFFLFALLKWKKSEQAKWLYFAALTFGLILLLRPSNGIVVLLYFALFGSLKEAWFFLRKQFLSSLTRMALSFLCIFAFVLIQFINVRLQTGHFAFNLYSDETFSNWNQPPIFKVLFGFKKGLFPYAPLTLFAFLGIFFSFSKYRFQTFVTLLFFALFTYITASWWCWWYGGSVGLRPMVDISILFVVGLALILDRGKLMVQLATLPVIGFGIYFQLTLTHQFENGILHYEAMDQNRYEYIFLKTDRRFQWMYYIDSPKTLKAAAITKTLHYDATKKTFVNTNLPKKDRFEIEHMTAVDLFQYKIDSTGVDTIQGIRLEGKMTLRDKNNIPLLIVYANRNGESTQIQTDFVGMRIKNIQEATYFESDFVFPNDVPTYDFLTFQFGNSHGKTTIDDFKIKILAK
ncbi:MAG: hypothetical protein WC044_09670 [Crocinitomicaceae bacterium]